jgi:ribose-phosphate pyrophosphokinase
MCYMRQDTAFHPGEAISQKVIGQLLAQAFDCIVTVDAHLHRVQNIRDVFSGIEAHDLSAVTAIADELAPLSGNERTIIAGPDAESEVWVRDLATRLRLPCTIATKTRRGDRSVIVDFPDAKHITGRDVILLDDMVSSGGTILAAAKALEMLGAINVDVVVTHALFDAATAGAFAAAGIRSIRSADGVPHPSNAFGLANTLAKALKEEVAP